MAHFKVLLRKDLFFKMLDLYTVVYPHSSKSSLKIWVHFSQLLFTVTYFSIAGWIFPQNKAFYGEWQKVILSETFEWLTFARMLYTCIYESWGPKSWSWLFFVVGLCLWIAPWEGSSRDIHRPVLSWAGSLFWCLIKERAQPHIVYYAVYCTPCSNIPSRSDIENYPFSLYVLLKNIFYGIPFNSILNLFPCWN